MLQVSWARCFLLVYSGMLTVITKESFVKIILYLCAMSTMWTGSCFQGTYEIQLEGGDADTDTIEDQSTVDAWKGTQEEPLRSFRGETWYSSKLVFDWGFFLFVCFCFLAMLCSLWDLSSVTRVTAVKARILTTLDHQESPLDWSFECWIGIC